jgi:hypothetical protein
MTNRAARFKPAGPATPPAVLSARAELEPRF